MNAACHSARLPRLCPRLPWLLGRLSRRGCCFSSPCPFLLPALPQPPGRWGFPWLGAVMLVLAGTFSSQRQRGAERPSRLSRFDVTLKTWVYQKPESKLIIHSQAKCFSFALFFREMLLSETYQATEFACRKLIFQPANEDFLGSNVQIPIRRRLVSTGALVTVTF